MGVCKNHPYLRSDLVFLHQLYIVLQLTPNLFFLGVLFHWLCEVWASHRVFQCSFSTCQTVLDVSTTWSLFAECLRQFLGKV